MTDRTEDKDISEKALLSDVEEKMQDHLRMVEAVLFASERPLSIEDIAVRLPHGADIPAHLATLQATYENRGINLVHVAGKYQFRTARDLAFLMRHEVEEQRKLSRAAVETLAIIAYHQPVTRAEIEEIRGVGLSRGTLDVLLEAGWIRPKGRRQTPGRPLMYATSDEFLVHFGLASLDELPGLNELKATGMLDSVDEALDRLEQEASPSTSALDHEEELPFDEEAEQSFEDESDAEMLRERGK